MKNFPKVFIIILNYNGRNCLFETLSSVFKTDYPNFKIILVDNNSTDGSFELTRSNFSKAIFIRNNQNLGFSAGNNIGIKYALERGADYILLLNYDTETEKNSLKNLIEAAEKEKDIGIASPIILKNDKRTIWFSGGKINWLTMKTKHKRNNLSRDYFDSNYISGCAMLIKSEVFKKIGLLDENFFLYWEDVDFSLRAKKAGYKLLVSPQSRIVHQERSEIRPRIKNLTTQPVNSNLQNFSVEAEKENKIYWLVISGLIFFRKNISFWLKPYIFFYVFLRELKNKFDLKFRKNSIAEAVQKAYKDFNYVK